ncbi:MAG: hypothetical protein IIT57_07715, partial [Treponema sp.]|nr:hypothetical protein [Treponema sp.]
NKKALPFPAVNASKKQGLFTTPSADIRYQTPFGARSYAAGFAPRKCFFAAFPASIPALS